MYLFLDRLSFGIWHQCHVSCEFNGIHYFALVFLAKSGSRMAGTAAVEREPDMNAGTALGTGWQRGNWRR